MGLFDKLKKRNKDNANKEVEIFAKNYSATAVDYAKHFNKNFDYSKDSIADLEEILDYYSKDISVSKPTENQIWSMSVIFGSYLGETLLKNGLSQKGYSWTNVGSSNIPVLSGSDGSYLAPNDKVFKRLVNGPEDSVVSFYQYALEKV